LLQVAAVSFAVWRLFSRLLTKLKDGTISQAHISVSSKVDELFMMIQCGSRLFAIQHYSITSVRIAYLCRGCIWNSQFVNLYS
jgi:hypothetical protein